MEPKAILVGAIILAGLICLLAGLWRPRWGLMLPLALMPLVSMAVGFGGRWTLSSGKVFLAAFGLAFAAAWLRGPRPLGVPAELKAVAALYGAAIVASSLASGTLLPFSWWYIGKEAGYFLVFAGALWLLDGPRQIERAVRVVVWTGALVALLWYVQQGLTLAGWNPTFVLWMGTGDDQLVRAGSTIGHKNYYAAYMILVISLTVGWVRARGRCGIFLAIALAFEGFSLLASGSAGGVAAFALTCGGWWAVRRFGLWRVGVAAGFAAALTAAAVGSVGVERVAAGLRGYASVASIESRIYPALVSWELTAERPFLGYGPGSFVRSLLGDEKRMEAEGRLPSFRKPPFRKEGGFSSHNSYLEALVEKGLAGFVLLCALLWGLIHPLFRRAPPPEGGRWADAGRWMGLGLIAVCLQALTENILTHTVVMSQFFFVTALAWRMIRPPDGEAA